jgi:MFS family permease
MKKPIYKLLGPLFDDLWRKRDFRLLWGSLTITHFGGQITFLALPLTAALLLHATPFQVGMLTALEALPYTLFGLFVGVLVDRSRKLPLIIIADIGRGLALLAVPAAAWFGMLSMPVLYIVGFLAGTGGMVGWAAYQVFMTERVGRENLVQANSKIALSESSAQLIGPGIAGVAIEWLTAPFAIFLDACTFFISAWMLRSIHAGPKDTPKPRGWTSVWREIGEGLRLIWHNRLLRSIAWGLGLWNLLRHMYLAVIILFATRDLALTPGNVGLAWMGGGVGCLAAAFVAKRANKRLGVGAVMLGGIFLTGIAWSALAFTQPGSVLTIPLLAGAIFAYDLGGTLFFINYLSLRQAVTPDHLLGRVISTMIFLTVATAPVGSLLGGALGEIVGLRNTLGVTAISGIVLGLLLMRLSPISGIRVLPQHG